MTLYAHVAGSTVDTVSALPRLYFDGIEWHDWRGDPPWRTSPGDVGWFPIALAPRPPDTDTDTYVEDVTLVDGLPVQTWTSRPWTAEQLAARQAAADRKANRAAVKAIITDLQAEKARCDVVIAKPNNTITGADTKDVARAGKRIADAAIELARFVRDM